MRAATLPGLLFAAFCGLAGCGSQTDRGATQQRSQNQAQEAPSQAAEEQKTILCFGNSLTYGYGLDNPREEAWPALLQDRLDSLGYERHRVVNAGLSGETTSGGRSRLDWVLERNPQLSVFILELGANDGLRGIPPEETQRNLRAIIDTVKKQHPQARILLCGMKVPPNMGEEYAGDFQAIFQEVADRESVALVPFLLKGVAGNPALNQEDGIHPTAQGHRVMLDNLWPKLKPLLEQATAARRPGGG